MNNLNNRESRSGEGGGGERRKGASVQRSSTEPQSTEHKGRPRTQPHHPPRSAISAMSQAKAQSTPSTTRGPVGPVPAERHSGTAQSVPRAAGSGSRWKMDRYAASGSKISDIATSTAAPLQQESERPHGVSFFPPIFLVLGAGEARKSGGEAAEAQFPRRQPAQWPNRGKHRAAYVCHKTAHSYSPIVDPSDRKSVV